MRDALLMLNSLVGDNIIAAHALAGSCTSRQRGGVVAP